MHKKGEANHIPRPRMERVAIPQLDFIRVFAMFGIFSHHLWKTVITAPQGTLQSTLDILFSAASDGVILFNITSGILLAMPHLGPERRPFAGYRSFMQKRFLRIIPPYYLALLFFTLANIQHFSVPLTHAMDTLLQHLLFINSLDYSNMYLNFSHFWYLGLLAQFYLLFPLFLSLFLRIGAVRAALSIIILCWGSWLILAWYFPTTPESFPSLAEKLMHFNLPGRLPEFAIGMWLASLWSPSAASIRRPFLWSPFSFFTAALILYLIAGALFSADSMNLPFLHIYHVARSVVLFLVLLVWTPVAGVGKFAFLKNISAQSFAIYIVHHPLFSYVGVMPTTVTHTLGNFVFLMAVLLPLSYLAAIILNLLSGEILKIFSRRENSSRQ